MNILIGLVIFFLFLMYALYVFLFKFWLFEIRCPHCHELNKVKWKFEDGARSNSKNYYFMCGDCNIKIYIVDESNFQGSLPSFVICSQQNNAILNASKFLSIVNRGIPSNQ